METTDAGWADYPMISTEQCPRLSIERRKHHAVRQRGGISSRFTSVTFFLYRTASLYLPPSMYVWMYPRATVPPGRCSEQPAPAPGCQGMSCGLLGGRFAIRSAPGPLAALV